MKQILFILTFCLVFLNSNAQQKDYPLYADGIVEFGYVVDDDVYYIIYRDTTNFPDFKIFEDEGWYQETYLNLHCNREDFFNYLFWFSEEQERKTNLFYDKDSRYFIRETIIEHPLDGITHKYQLIKR